MLISEQLGVLQLKTRQSLYVHHLVKWYRADVGPQIISLDYASNYVAYVNYF
jgi:hypothetical protein